MQPGTGVHVVTHTEMTTTRRWTRVASSTLSSRASTTPFPSRGRGSRAGRSGLRQATTPGPPAARPKWEYYAAKCIKNIKFNVDERKREARSPVESCHAASFA